MLLVRIFNSRVTTSTAAAALHTCTDNAQRLVMSVCVWTGGACFCQASAEAAKGGGGGGGRGRAGIGRRICPELVLY